MQSRGIRGAITVESNTCDAIAVATVELLDEILQKNFIYSEDISHVIFTMTDDLTAAYPAKYAREKLGWNEVPLVCFQELSIENSLKMCLRVLIVVNTDKSQSEIKHVYLKDAQKLRPDIP